MLKKCKRCGWPITYTQGCPKCGNIEREYTPYFGGAGYDFEMY